MKPDATAVVIGEKTYQVLPINIKTFRKIAPILDELKTGLSLLEMTSKTMEIMHLIVSRGNPDVTVDELEENIDVVNRNEIFSELLSAAGLKMVKEPSEGEPQAASA